MIHYPRTLKKYGTFSPANYTQIDLSNFVVMTLFLNDIWQCSGTTQCWSLGLASTHKPRAHPIEFSCSLKLHTHITNTCLESFTTMNIIFLLENKWEAIFSGMCSSLNVIKKRKYSGKKHQHCKNYIAIELKVYCILRIEILMSTEVAKLGSKDNTGSEE